MPIIRTEEENEARRLARRARREQRRADSRVRWAAQAEDLDHWLTRFGPAPTPAV